MTTPFTSLTLSNDWLLAAGALVCLILGGWLFNRIRRAWQGVTLRRRFGRARRGEESARPWLEDHGFTVLDAQVDRECILIVDGASTPFTVRADYLVEKRGVRAVVEVKTGAVAKPTERGTRRQILEYAQVYDVAEVYLFNADAQKLQRIELPTGMRLTTGHWALRRPTLVAFAAGIIVGLAAAWSVFK